MRPTKGIPSVVADLMQVMNRLNRAQKLLKISKQKDYYKVLGVPRDADDRTIKRAL